MTINRKPTQPGEVLLEDVLKPLGLTITEAAQDLGGNRKTLKLGRVAFEGNPEELKGNKQKIKELFL